MGFIDKKKKGDLFSCFPKAFSKAQTVEHNNAKISSFPTKFTNICKVNVVSFLQINALRNA